MARNADTGVQRRRFIDLLVVNIPNLVETTLLTKNTKTRVALRHGGSRMHTADGWQHAGLFRDNSHAIQWHSHVAKTSLFATELAMEVGLDVVRCRG